jgi:uncharacterized protein
MWTWVQRWSDLLFLHWPMPIAALEERLPAGVEADTWQGSAWMSFILFRLKVRPAWLPFLPGVSDLTEINLRTYVRCGSRTGVWFLSMHADNRWAVRLAKLLTPLPYYHTPLSYQCMGTAFGFTGCGALSPDVPRTLTFQPKGEVRAAADEALDAWLLERYRAFVGIPDGITEAEVAHVPWMIRAVELSWEAGGLGESWGLDLSRPPERCHFAAGVEARFGRFRRRKNAAQRSFIISDGSLMVGG